MTYKEFIAECNTRLINPSIAAENDLVVFYLSRNMDEMVLAILDSDF